MLFFDAGPGESKIAGMGLFLRAPAPMGSVVSIHSIDTKLISEAEYKEEERRGNELVIRSGIRWVGPHFIYAKQIPVEAYINHSSDPTLLYHCGVSFARRDLKPGDELTIDYTLFLAEDDEDSFCDVATGKMVLGLPPREALLKSGEELVKILSQIREMP